MADRMFAMMEATPQKTQYAFARAVIGLLHILAVGCLVVGLVVGASVLIVVGGMNDGSAPSGWLAGMLNGLSREALRIVAVVASCGGLTGFALLAGAAQFLKIQRDRAANNTLQVQLLEDILELNEESVTASIQSRVELCEGCGRLASLHRIDSGQWVCRECRRQLRSA